MTTRAPILREMIPADYPEVYRLWTKTEGLCLGDDDAQERIALYLARNPGLCFIALEDLQIVGTVLAGHDGRRGILRHLAVSRDCRRRGLGRRLVRHALDGLASQGIRKCNIFVMDDNPGGIQFWEHLGFQRLADDYRTMQLPTAHL